MRAEQPALLVRERAGWRLSTALENRHILGLLFVAPMVLILGGLLAYPFLLGVWISLTDAVIGRPGRFVGLENYLFLLEEPIFWLVAFNTVLYTAVATVLKLGLGMGLALTMNQEFRGKGLVRAIALLPWIVPTALSALVWWWMFDATFSIVNWGLTRLGVLSQPINFLGDPNLARLSIILANTWRGIPFFGIGLLAGLQTISPSLYEAAAIDGATGWQRFKTITWPLLKPVTMVVTVFSVVMTFADFQLVWVMTKGGPANATHLFGTYAYQRAIQAGYLSEGAAIALFIFPVLAIGAILSMITLRKED